MWYRVVGDAVMLAHFAFLAYLVVGGFLAAVAVEHLGARRGGHVQALQRARRLARAR